MALHTLVVIIAVFAEAVSSVNSSGLPCPPLSRETVLGRISEGGAERTWMFAIVEIRSAASELAVAGSLAIFPRIA